MWSLKYADTDYSFDQVMVTSVRIDGRTYRVDDTPNPRSDGVTFGEDFADPGDVKLSLLLNYQHVRNVTMQRAMLMEAAAAFIEAWDAVALRSIPGAVGELLIPSIGLLEGRPRRAEWDMSTLGLGHLLGTATFIRSDHSIYELDAAGEASWRSATLRMVAAQSGGLKAPLKAPLRTTVESTRATSIDVTGSQPAYGIYEVSGPIQSDARLVVPHRWSLFLNRSLKANDTVTIDTRPGRAATYLNGAAVQLLDPRSSLLAECTLLPGPNVLALRGVSIEGTSAVSVRWRERTGAL